MRPVTAEIIYYRRWDTAELFRFYKALQLEEQRIRNKMAVIKAELDRRVKAEPLPPNYCAGSDVVSEEARS